MSTFDAPTAATKVCRICGEQKTVSEFRPRSRDGSQRQSECRSCHNLNERLCRAARKDRAVAAFVKGLAARRDLDRIVLMAKAAIKSQGGLQGFAEEWRRQHQRAMTESPETAYRYLSATLRLLELGARLESGRKEIPQYELPNQSPRRLAVADEPRSQAIKRTLDERRERELPPNGKAPIGFKLVGEGAKQQLVPDLKEQSIMLKIFQLRRSGLPFSEIRLLLLKDRVRFRRKSESREWSESRIRRAYEAFVKLRQSEADPVESLEVKSG